MTYHIDFLRAFHFCAKKHKKHTFIVNENTHINKKSAPQHFQKKISLKNKNGAA